MELAKNNGKYLFIRDLNGNVPVFSQYQHTLNDFNKEVMKTNINQQSAEDSLEKLRKPMINSMRLGSNYVINIGSMTPDFKSQFTSDSIFPADKVFDREHWFEHDNYIKFVKEDENFGLGGLNPGHYYMAKDFNLVIVSDAEDEEDIQAQLDAIPHSDKFEKITIQ